MKKWISLFFFFFVLPAVLTAKTAEDNRRIEEEKRGNLRSTEVEVYQKQLSDLKPTGSTGIDYFKTLLSKKIILCAEGFNAVAHLMGIEDYAKDFASQTAFFKEKEVITERIARELNPNLPLRKGLTAYILCRALGIKGGVWLRLFGMSERYALRELVFEEIMSPGNINDVMSGKEFVITLTKAAEYTVKKTEFAYSKSKP